MNLFVQNVWLICLALFFLRAMVNSYILNRINNTKHFLFFLVPWNKGAYAHGINALVTFHWTIHKEINNGVKQGKQISNMMSIGCGLLIVLTFLVPYISHLIK